MYKINILLRQNKILNFTFINVINSKNIEAFLYLVIAQTRCYFFLTKYIYIFINCNNYIFYLRNINYTNTFRINLLD